MDGQMCDLGAFTTSPPTGLAWRLAYARAPCRLQQPAPDAKLDSMNTRTATPLPSALLGLQDARHLLVLAMLALPVAGHLSGTSGRLSLLFLVVVAAVDAIIGTHPSASKPHPWPAMRHPWFSGFLYGYAFLHVALLVWAIAIIAADPSIEDALWRAVSIGFVTGTFGITIAHELGHRASRLDRGLSQLLLVTVCYGHFYVEHNRGHHVRVATANDPATARLGESFYRFYPRTVYGSFAHAWRLEALRLEAQGGRAWSFDNRIVWLVGAALLLCACAWLAAGLPGLVFFVFQSVVAFTLLELVNYVEHYGLTRKREANGRVERVEPHHSWNSDTWFGNALLVNLQRHSDHHADSSRPYEALRSIDAAPQLPTGYAGMILLAMMPPLWFRVMDNRALAASAAA